jgi:hypothetical protein
VVRVFRGFSFSAPRTAANVAKPEPLNTRTTRKYTKQNASP